VSSSSSIACGRRESLVARKKQEAGSSKPDRAHNSPHRSRLASRASLIPAQPMHHAGEACQCPVCVIPPHGFASDIPGPRCSARVQPPTNHFLSPRLLTPFNRLPAPQLPQARQREAPLVRRESRKRQNNGQSEKCPCSNDGLFQLDAD
jgi:hypothetical protein